MFPFPAPPAGKVGRKAPAKGMTKPAMKTPKAAAKKAPAKKSSRGC
jgi:hypothetical protein